VTEAPLWRDQSFLRNVQYADDSNLSARQSIYSYQRPSVDISAMVIGSLRLTGRESVADVGCGNGLYLRELGRRRHGGRVVGIDMSAGMLAAARTMAAALPAARLLAGDASELPLRDESVDVALAAHMLYHVPRPAEAIGELRRVIRSGGRLVVVLNGEDHLRELSELMASAAAELGLGMTHAPGELLSIDQGEDLLDGYFGTVTRQDFAGELLLPAPQPAAGYVRSMSVTQVMAEQERLISAVSDRMPFGADGLFRVRTHWGSLTCR
jgi:SAM-dependent methyltransferase